MAPTAKKQKEKKEKAFHPGSRKAGQIERKSLRKDKLALAGSKKTKINRSQVDKFAFFYHAMPPDQDCITLEELHDLIKDVWLTRHDIELETEIAERRAGRPKSAKQVKLEAVKEADLEEYRTGLEVVDLTNTPTVELFRRWDQKNLSFIDLLRFIRISSGDPTEVVVSRPGKHESLIPPPELVPKSLAVGDQMEE